MRPAGAAGIGWSRFSPGTRRAVWALLGMGAAIVAWKGVWPALGNARGDFANYYTAARLVRDGRSIAPAYSDFTWFQQQMDRYGFEGQLGGFIPHPPPTALVMLPLSGLDAVAARSAFTLINAALIPVAIALLAGVARLPWPVAGLLLLGTASGLLNDLLFGQLYLPLLVSILLGLRFAERGHPVAAGIALGGLLPVKYFGGFFVVYFLWRRQWRLVGAAAATAAALTLVALALVGREAFEVFAVQVLPHHLRGAIQDPYALFFQSWSSLSHRLFVHEPVLNPQPWRASPLAFAAARQLTFWPLLALGLFVATRARLGDPDRERRFALAWIPLLLLLLSPGPASYHFLLLSISAALLVGLLLEAGRSGAALALALVYAAVNLPHYPRLAALASSDWAPLAWTRLWLMLGFAVATAIAFRSSVDWSGAPRRLAASLLVAGLATAAAVARPAAAAEPGVQPLTLPGTAFTHRTGLFLHGPSLGGSRLVFGDSLPGEERYSVFTADGDDWLPGVRHNAYRPDLAADGMRLLVERVHGTRGEIWLSQAPGQPLRLVALGRSPDWHPDRRRFAFEREGEIRILDLGTGDETAQPAGGAAADPAFSASGEGLAWVEADGAQARLVVREAPGEPPVVVHSALGLAEPAWSGDGRWLLFSQRAGAGEDLYALELATRRLLRLTRHPALDRSPVWDAARERIVFLSDRGRGLACFGLYWMPIPVELRP